MPAVFVHGVPDTARVWKPVLARLSRQDVVTLSLPGFGRPTGDGFDATKEAYARWLLDELAAQPAPIDVVGHDWGALLVVRAISIAPDRVRSWVVGGAPLDPDYEWHPAARLWQTPEVGERVMEATTAPAMTKALVGAGVPPADAADAAEHVDSTMKRFLTLYRSAVNVGREWSGDQHPDLHARDQLRDRLAARGAAPLAGRDAATRRWCSLGGRGAADPGGQR